MEEDRRMGNIEVSGLRMENCEVETEQGNEGAQSHQQLLETVWTEPPGKGLILSSLGSVR